MLGTAILLGSLILLITMMCAFLITKLPHKTWIKFILIPLILALGVMAFVTVPELMGYPYPGVPGGHFQVEDVKLGNGNGGLKIEFWAMEHGESRLYTIPYDAQIMQQLRDAAEAGKSGRGRTDLQFKKKGSGGSGESYAYSLEGHFNPLMKAMPPKSEPTIPGTQMLGGPPHP